MLATLIEIEEESYRDTRHILMMAPGIRLCILKKFFFFLVFCFDSIQLISYKDDWLYASKYWSTEELCGDKTNLPPFIHYDISIAFKQPTIISFLKKKSSTGNSCVTFLFSLYE